MRRLGFVASLVAFALAAVDGGAAENPPLTFLSSPDKVPMTDGGTRDRKSVV